MHARPALAPVPQISPPPKNLPPAKAASSHPSPDFSENFSATSQSQPPKKTVIAVAKVAAIVLADAPKAKVATAAAKVATVAAKTVDAVVKAAIAAVKTVDAMATAPVATTAAATKTPSLD
jgi:hypothetical protein